MNAIMQITEIHREQHEANLERLRRLGVGRPPKAIQIAAPTVVTLQIVKRPNVRGKVPQANVAKVLAEQDERIKNLELDLADAQARLLTQAEHICILNDLETGSPASYRKAAAIIIHEVLQDFPGVTWEDLKSVRRERRLVRPRQICMAALYEQRKDLSLPVIGRMFHRDHTTVLHAVHKLRAEKEGQTT